MKISKKSLGKQHSLISVQLIEKDYSEKVNEILVNYSKTANMPGFRKGHIPLGLVKKQYGKAVIVDEVNKIIQEELRKYLVTEKLDILGSPLPVSNDDIDWTSGELNFDFEIGLTPDFDINLKSSFFADCITGCFHLYKTDDFIELNGFDERYFLYMEDVDICRKIEKLDKKKLYYPKEEITHVLKQGSLVC